MRPHLFIPHIFWLTLLLLQACSPSPQRRALYRAESLLDSHPDSALVILDSIDRSALSSDEEKAIHAILLTEARYKSGFDDTDDSLISTAADYFLTEKVSDYRWKAFYYKGVVDYFSGDFGNALISLMHSEKTAASIDDYLMLGLTHRAMADVFDKIKNEKSALKYYKLSFSEFSNQEDDEYTDHALFDICRIYNILSMTDSCLSVAYKVKDTAEIKKDTLLLCSSLGIIGENLVVAGQYDEAVRLLERKRLLNGQLFSGRDWTHLGEAYLGLGDIQSATGCKDSIDSDIESSWLSYRIARINGDYKNAVEYVIQNMKLNDDIFSDWITRVQEQTLYENYKLSEANVLIERNKNKYMTLTVIFASLVLILVLAIVGRRYRMIRQERENH